MDVLAIARRSLELGPICDACLGRCVADRSHGLANAERGRALRTAVALADDEPFDRDDEPCWVCEGICAHFDELAERAVEAVGDHEFDTYQVGTRPPRFVEENDRLLREEARGDAGTGEPLKTEVNREVGKRIGSRTGARFDFERPDVVVLLDIEADEIDVTVNSAFVFGRYRKLERGIPQTRWPCRDCDGTGQLDGDPCPGCGGSGLRYDRSVEQLIAPVIRSAMDGSDATFHGAGREDIDARMLGPGRPFVVEVDEPRLRHVDTDRLEARINDEAAATVEVRDLSLATYRMVEHVKELDASKTYEAQLAFDQPVDRHRLREAVAIIASATVEQRTPTRVSHRRADIERTREVYDAEVVEAEATTATVRIHGEGGLYIKELLHGDDGRTTPSLAGLLDVGVTVEALDVLDVEAEGDRTFAAEDLLRNVR